MPPKTIFTVVIVGYDGVRRLNHVAAKTMTGAKRVARNTWPSAKQLEIEGPDNIIRTIEGKERRGAR